MLFLNKLLIKWLFLVQFGINNHVKFFKTYKILYSPLVLWAYATFCIRKKKITCAYLFITIEIIWLPKLIFVKFSSCVLFCFKTPRKHTLKMWFSSREKMIGWSWWRHGSVQSKCRHFEHGCVLVSCVLSQACILQSVSWKWSWPGRCLVAVNENHPRDTACIA